MNEMDINQLLKRYESGECTPEESAFVESWYNQAATNADKLPTVPDMEERKEMTWNALQVPEAAKVYALWKKITVAAAVATIVFGVWLFNAPRHSGEGRNPGSAQYANDIAPGKNTATLRLANGQVIQLSDAKTGVVIDAGSLKYSDGSAIRHADLNDRDADIGDRHPDMNGRHPDAGQDPGPAKSNGIPFWSGALTSSSAGSYETKNNKNNLVKQVQDDVEVRTPRGGTYQVILSDGSKVWLNADSKLTFPSSFKGSKQRLVQLSGEAYFEVAKDKANPFIVESKDQQVEVLGTHFNIRSYAEEPSVKTTLLEGSVRVGYAPRHPGLDPGSQNRKAARHDVNDKAGVLNQVQDDDRFSQAVTLKPNQQSILSGSDRMAVKEIDPEQVTDWKNGDFVFQEESLASIMRKVSRWYDVEVIYGADVDQNQTFGGKVSRKRNISQVIKALQTTQALKFKIEGRKVFVTN